MASEMSDSSLRTVSSSVRSRRCFSFSVIFFSLPSVSPTSDTLSPEASDGARRMTDVLTERVRPPTG